MRVMPRIVFATARAMDWVPLGVAALVSVLITAWGFTGPYVDTDLLAVSLRSAAVLLGAAAGFGLADAAENTTAASPVPRWMRQWTRTLLAGAAAAAGWGVTYLSVELRLPEEHSGVFAGLPVEAAVVILTGLACTSVVRRRMNGYPAALIGSTVLLVLVAVSLMYRSEFWLWYPPSAPEWEGLHRVWAVLIPLPLLMLVVGNRENPR
ncbi:hypothetical protein [Nocardiopsis valliformis]|uniref:hypothetical protein n=1 Tax=Nocardiopsis valliformis TaxID=239974 RepID=UPI0003807853|nr:hypothetical protein [Nocardiopsis valliformis]